MATPFDEVLFELKRARGLDLSGYRRSMLQRRLKARLARLRCDDLDAYLQRLRDDPSECDRLIDAIAINVSAFFRDPVVWEIMAQSVLPEIVQRKAAQGSNEIRAWSAGCAAGEEAYSLAMLLDQAVQGESSDWQLFTFATDIDQSALQRAREGIYPRESVNHVKLAFLDRYFNVRGELFEVSPSLRERVWFSRSDLTSAAGFTPTESVFGTFDVVLCRNALIYFSREFQDRVFKTLSRSLASGGYLILGQSESLDNAMKSKMRVVDRRNRVYQVP